MSSLSNNSPYMHFPEYDQIVKSIRRADAMLMGQRKALELLAKRAPLFDILHLLVSILEEQYDGLLCSILLVDEETQTFKAGVDVSHSKNYSLETSGVSILPPYTGPCCKAANLGELVVTEDISSDQSWGDGWKNWALSNSLRSCRSHPIFSSTGSVLGTFAMYHKNYADPTLANLYQVEITTHIAGIAIERKLIEARETEWREKMQGINEELSRAVKLRDEFLSMTSHEISSPLATMKMWTTYEKENLLEGGSFDRIDFLKMLEQHEQQIDRLIGTVRAITDTSYLNTEQQKLKLNHLNVGELVREISNRLMPLISEAKCHLVLEVEDGLQGEWDPIRVEQVMTNLITNATKYGGPGVIRIAVKKLANNVQITIQDFGKGIAKEDHEKIFEKYGRVKSNDPGIRGLGLGLFIVRDIVRAHGGHIYVESDLGQGSQFIIELPCISH